MTNFISVRSITKFNDFCHNSNSLYSTDYTFLASNKYKLLAFIDPVIERSMFMLSFIFVIVSGFFLVETF